MGACRKHETLRSETEDFITHGAARSMSTSTCTNSPCHQVPLEECCQPRFAIQTRNTEPKAHDILLVSSKQTCFLFQRETLPYPSSLFTVNIITLRNSPDEEESKLCILGMCTKKVQSPWQIASLNNKEFLIVKRAGYMQEEQGYSRCSHPET